jgi:hypothetical protein
MAVLYSPARGLYAQIISSSGQLFQRVYYISRYGAAGLRTACRGCRALVYSFTIAWGSNLRLSSPIWLVEFMTFASGARCELSKEAGEREEKGIEGYGFTRLLVVS